MEVPKIAEGLEGVYVCKTNLSHVDGEAGKLIYRGHDAVSLARSQSFEAVWFLLREGRLPSAEELAAFSAKVADHGRLSAAEVELVAAIETDIPLTLIRVAIDSIAARRNLKPWLNRDVAVVHEEIFSLACLVPSILEINKSKSAPVEKPDAGYVERHLWGLTGRKPPAEHVAALQTYMILTMDHGLNASTFSARVTFSTGADPGAALTAAVGTLSGPLHGGAPGPVLDMLDAVATPERAIDWIAGEFAAGRRLMGFGHRVYKVDDPRSLCLKEVAFKLAGQRVELAKSVEAEALKALAERKKSRPLRVNVEFWTALVLESVGLDRRYFAASFGAARIAGWAEHMREQMQGNRIYRPLSVYSGPLPS